MMTPALEADLRHFLKEDDLGDHLYYLSQLPSDLVTCQLKIKSSMLVSGLPFFCAIFDLLGSPLSYDLKKKLLSFEGQWVKADPEVILCEFEVPFSIALSAERLALNLLGHCSKISSFTKRFVDKATDHHISIIDTRKTTPGLRSLEKYAVRVGGGHNHRFGQTDLWMVKDNHKAFFGGVKPAIEFFRSMQGFYTPILVEVHNLQELEEAIETEVHHVMLDNFTPELVKRAIDRKPDFMSFEVSGGVSLENLESFLIRGVDAISIGKLTYGAPPVDVSLKMKKVPVC
jgi:nicotinate-nucleotide pyrophosphorylase (carboxylating)